MKSPFINRICSQPGANRRDKEELNPHGITWLTCLMDVEEVEKIKERRRYIEFNDYTNKLNQMYK